MATATIRIGKRAGEREAHEDADHRRRDRVDDPPAAGERLDGGLARIAPARRRSRTAESRKTL